MKIEGYRPDPSLADASGERLSFPFYHYNNHIASQ